MVSLAARSRKLVVTGVTISGKGNTFINFGGEYPQQTFTGWIPKDSELAGGSTLAGLASLSTRSKTKTRNAEFICCFTYRSRKSMKTDSASGGRITLALI